MVWVGLPLNDSTERPDFLVVHANSTAFAIAVAGATKMEVDERVNGSLFATFSSNPEVPSGVEGLGFVEWRRVNAFINTTKLPEDADRATDTGPPAVYGLVVFPNVSHEKLRQAWSKNPADGCYWLGSEYVTSERMAASLRKLSTGGLAERQLASLRQQLYRL